jgi:hypothetical protein
MQPNRKPQGHPVGTSRDGAPSGQGTGGTLGGHIAYTLSDFFD